jgi:putative membrane protein
MDWELSAGFIAGVLMGLASGLLPGLHANTVVSAIANSGIDGSMMAVVIISLFPANLITAFIPAIFFGVPEESTVVATLPGHRMLLAGKGLLALKAVLLSCGFAALLSCALFFISLDAFPVVYSALREHMEYVVLLLSGILILRSKNKALSLFFFLVSGMLGLFSLNSSMEDPFLPLFSGMFAMGTILNYRKKDMPEQKDGRVGLSFLKFSAIGVFLGMIADLLPGISSPSQVATFSSLALPMNSIGYLAALGSISVSEAVFSLATTASIGKSRIGTTVWLSKFIDIENNLLLLISLFLISSAICVLVLFLLRKKVAMIGSMDFSKMNMILAAYLFILTFLLSGITGIAVFLVASGLGWVAFRSGVERTMLMGAVIVPTLLLLFGIFI